MFKTKFKSESEHFSELHNFVQDITMLQNLLAPDRKTAKDLPRDKHKRIIVDLANPHKLENMNYFRQPAITFEKTGRYTSAYPSKDPNSPYRKFWDGEKEKCLKGMVRKSDGEWITGYHYYYLNYSPIMKTVVVGDRNEDGSVQSDRVSGFPDMWDGDYLYFHYVDLAEKAGKYGAVLKARGKGYSFKAASMLARNYNLYKDSKSFAFASDKEYLDTDGVLNKAWTYLDFSVKHVGFAKKLRLKDTMMEKKAGYKRPGDPVEYGFLSSISGVTMKNNPDKSRGKRGVLIIWEEAGMFPNIIKSWRISQKSMEDGNRVFGFMVAFGTGGEEGANFEGLEALFYKAKAYRVLTMPNVYDRNAKEQTCAFFVPDYFNRADCYDKNGNSDVVKALEEIITKRLAIKYSGVDSSDLAQVIAEEAVTPQEAIMTTESTVFPVEELKNHLASIIPKIDSFTSSHYVGDLIMVGANSVEFKPDFAKVPLREYPIRKGNIEGAVEIFEMPRKSDGGNVPAMRYIGGCDTVDDDTGTSLFSIQIMDLITDTIVAEWTGRYRRAEKNFEIALKLAMFYNAQINYENKLKGMFSYFDRKSALMYLCDTPEILQDMDYIQSKQRLGNKKKGTPPTATINMWGRRLQADWMLTPNEFHGDLNYTHIRSIGYIREAIAWNTFGNFDRVSSGIMLFILREDRRKFIENRDMEEEEDDYMNDDFFTQDTIDITEDIEFI